MEQSDVNGLRISQVELDKVTEFNQMTKAHKVNGFDSTPIDSIENWVNNRLNSVERLVDEGDMRYKDNFFTGHGNFRNYQSMLDNGLVSNPEEFEKARRLWITMMEANPEFDLDGFMANSRPTVGNQQLMHGLSQGKDVGWEEIRRGNAPVMGNFSKRARILSLMKKAPLGILGLLAASGATYAADGGSEDDYLDHVLSNLEKYDQVSVQPGKKAIMQGADAIGAGDALRSTQNWFDKGMAQVPESATKSIANFMWGMGKDIVAEPVGLISSAFDWADRVSADTLQKQQQENLHSATISPRIGAYIKQQRREDMAPYAGLLEDRFFTRPR
jgi:hypothetical protein